MRRAPWVVLAALGLGGWGGCRGTSKSSDAGTVASVHASAAPSTPASEILSARIASDVRHAAGVPSALASSPDVAARRVSARALAQIGDAAAIERLGRALSDEDLEVVAWAAYGIALPCDVDADLAREERAKIVRALAARALTLDTKPAIARLDPWASIAWGLGRCGGIDASRELARWLSRDEPRARFAAFALGTIATHDRGLEDDVAFALVDAARGRAGVAPIDEALFPFGRGDWSSRPPVPKLAEVARLRLSAPGASRVFAIRALGRADGAKPDDLRALLADETTTAAERVEALRTLHRLGAGGDAEIAAFATRHAPTDEAKTKALQSASFGAIRVALELLGERPSTPTIATSLRAFLPPGVPPILASTPAPLARRIATLRCLAAAALHPGLPADPEIVRCAAHDASLPAPLRAELDAIRDGARLTALDRTEITGDRADLLFKLAKEGVPRVRERAFSILSKHTEAGEAPEVIVRAFGSKFVGVVAAAAQALGERPSIAYVVSKSAIKAALDPTAPAVDPTKVTHEIDPAVKKALDGALARPFEEADAEAKIALAQAVASLGHTAGRGFVLRLCGDRGPALRRAARIALARLDPPGKPEPCETIADHGTPSPLVSAPFSKKRVHLETDAGASLDLVLDPTFAPVAAARIAELASTGFFDGTPIHRVVPGFVVQLGDPGGDGYGGAHASLRCETAPVPFAHLDIGVALAGRDTGSSQIFVMLGRAPHLDGSYAFLGKAAGPWELIAEGDVVVKAKAE